MTYKVTISYDGSSFCGWAKQPNLKSIEETIEDKLSEFYQTKIRIFASGRTDAGVHALNQVFHFQEKEKQLKPSIIKKVFKNKFSREIIIKKIEVVSDDFHARFHAKNKTYLYVINMGKFSLFENNYLYNYNKKINIKKVREIASIFIGTHDFLCFSSHKENDSKRTINAIKITKQKDLLKIEINGNGFLRHMVRKIVYAIIAYSNDLYTEAYLENLLVNPERNLSLPKVVPNGLYLKKVNY